MLLRHRVALVTGSGRGIGRAIAQLFAKEGAAVFLTARTEKELASTAAAIEQNGGRAGYATADLSREVDCARIVAGAQEKFGKIDILVNNAGHYGPVEEPIDALADAIGQLIASESLMFRRGKANFRRSSLRSRSISSGAGCGERSTDSKSSLENATAPNCMKHSVEDGYWG